MKKTGIREDILGDTRTLQTITEKGSPSKWPVVELGAVCDIQLGKMLSPKSKVGIRPIPYLRNENVQWARFDLKDVSWMDFSEEEERKFLLRPGDLLACEGGEPGRAAIWQGEIDRCCYQKRCTAYALVTTKFIRHL